LIAVALAAVASSVTAYDQEEPLIAPANPVVTIHR
jgi:hypothetical protein